MKSSIDSSTHTNDEIKKIRRYAVIGAILWTLLLSGLFSAT